MSRITGRGATGPMDVFQVSTDTSLATLTGSRWDMSDGRQVILVQNNGTAIVPGKIYTIPVAVGANHQNLTVTAFAAASAGNLATVSATLGGTVVTANQYQGGFINVHDGTGVGQMLKVASHLAGTSSATVVFNLEDAPVTALDTTSKVDLVLNPYGSTGGTNFATNGVAIADADLLTVPVGISMYPIAASTATVAEYGFLQTKGLGSCLSEGTAAIGTDIGVSDAIDGAFEVYVPATSARIGTAAITAVDTKYTAIYINL